MSTALVTSAATELFWSLVAGLPFLHKSKQNTNNSNPRKSDTSKFNHDTNNQHFPWVVVQIMVPFWVPIIVRHLLFRVPKKGP